MVLLGICVGVCVVPGILLSSTRSVRVYNGDTVECDQPSGIWTESVKVSECGDYNGFLIDTFIVEGQLETHKENNEEYDGVQPAAVGRFGIPINVERVTYKFKGSAMILSICLQSTNATTTPVRLLVFDDLDKRDSYIEGKVNGEMSVYQQQLPVGSHSQMQCSDVVYRVTHAGYYCVALESPSGVIFKENLTENVISVNSSDYQAGCTVGKSDPCNEDIPCSSSVRILCHIPKNNPHEPTPQSTYLCSSRIPRYVLWTVPACVVFVTVAAIVVFVQFCGWRLIAGCRKCRQRQGYDPIAESSIQN